MSLKTPPFDASEYLDTDEGIEEFMKAAFEDGDPAFIARCLGIVAKARNMSQLARDTDMSRAALYKALSGEGNPEFATIMKVMKALGLELTPALSRAHQAETDEETAASHPGDAAA